MNEQDYEKLLHIKTAGDQKIFNDSLHYHRYEPTSYSMLEALSQQYPFTAEDRIVDFGCGKGRLAFYLSHYFNSTVTGIEMNPFFHQQALQNKESYQLNHKKKRKQDLIRFLHCLAENYTIDPKDNIFYFFNPFSLQIFTAVTSHIIASADEHPRIADIILYYPAYDYIYYLENNTPFRFLQNIQPPDCPGTDPRNRFSLYRLD